MPKRSNKWIDGLRPDMPVSRAAKKTLRRRLKPVWRLLTPAAKRADESPEHVHQLRVATRRAMAAMEGYAELLPRRKAEQIEKRLNRIRRRAGEARDYDVLLERLNGHPDAARLAPLVERIVDLRAAAQKPIVRIAAKVRRRNTADKARKLVKRIHSPKLSRETTFQQWARHGLTRQMEAFFTAGADDLGDVAKLHQFRIEGKHLRYALEYFAAAFGPELREEIYPEVERIQSLLGIVNDHASALVHFEQWRADWDDPELTTLVDEQIAAESLALHTAHQEFFRWWTPQRAADLKAKFAAVLRRPDEEHAA